MDFQITRLKPYKPRRKPLPKDPTLRAREIGNRIIAIFEAAQWVASWHRGMNAYLTDILKRGSEAV